MSKCMIVGKSACRIYYKAKQAYERKIKALVKQGVTEFYTIGRNDFELKNIFFIKNNFPQDVRFYIANLEVKALNKEEALTAELFGEYVGCDRCDVPREVYDNAANKLKEKCDYFIFGLENPGDAADEIAELTARGKNVTTIWLKQK